MTKLASSLSQTKLLIPFPTPSLVFSVKLIKGLQKQRNCLLAKILTNSAHSTLSLLCRMVNLACVKESWSLWRKIGKLHLLRCLQKAFMQPLCTCWTLIFKSGHLGVFLIIIWQDKSERSDWFFLDRDFTIRTVSVETVISFVFFVWDSRQIQNKHGPSAI